MKKFIYLIAVFTIFIFYISCATTDRTQVKEEVEVGGGGEEDVNPEVFLQSVMNGDFEYVKQLLDEGPDMNARDNKGNSALIIALDYGQTEVARLLIEGGANVNVQNNDGFTSLMYAVMNDYIDIVYLFLNTNTDVDAVENSAGLTALMLASYQGNEKAVRLLLKNGADPDSRSQQSKGWSTAMMFATIAGDVNVIDLLLENGAVVNRVNINGDTALTYAKNNGHDKAVQVLEEAEIRLFEKSFTIDEPQAWIHVHSGVRLPKRIGSFNRGAVLNFDAIGKMISVNYSAKKPDNLEVSVYIKPLSNSLSTGTTCEDELAVTTSSIVNQSSNTQLIETNSETIEFNDGSETMGHFAVFQLEDIFHDRKQKIELIVCITKKGTWFIKYRISYPGHERNIDSRRDAAMDFIQVFEFARVN